MRTHFIALVFVSLASTVSAQPVQGLYMSGSGGVAIPQDERLRTPHDTAPVAREPAPAGQASLGFGSGLRLEMEGLGRGPGATRTEQRP